MVETIQYDEINLAVLNFLFGNVNHICRLCFASTESKEICLKDTATIKTSWGTENVTFRSIFSELGVPLESSLPQTLCESCAMSALSSYSFCKLNQFSTEKWHNIITRLNGSLDATNIQNQVSQSVYVVLNKFDNIVFQSRAKCTEKTKKMALYKFKGILKRHRSLKKMEKKLDLSCSFCEKRFSNLILLKKHMKEHNKLSHPCGQCPKIFSSTFLLKEHNERIHNPKLLKCDQCSEKFSTDRQLKLHTRFYHVEVACKICHLKFKSRKELRPHLNNHSLLECEMCQKKFRNRQTFKRHTKSCHKDTQLQFICDLCNKIYAQKGTLQTHITTDHNFGHVLSCEWCDKKFDAFSKLKSHEVKHTKEKNFQCDQCGGKFVTKAALLYHTRLHTGETPYPCDLCSLSFLSASRRMEHKRRKHFGPQQECHVCKMKFVTGTQLRKHIQRHFNPQSKLYVPNIEEK